MEKENDNEKEPAGAEPRWLSYFRTKAAANAAAGAERNSLEAEAAEMRREMIEACAPLAKAAAKAPPEWVRALMYVGSLFEGLDSVPNADPRDIAARSRMWKIISDGVSNWYGQQGENM